VTAEDGDAANTHAAERLNRLRQQLTLDMRVAQDSLIEILTPSVHQPVLRQREHML
jgi:hypothetical protein